MKMFGSVFVADRTSMRTGSVVQSAKLLTIAAFLRNYLIETLADSERHGSVCVCVCVCVWFTFHVGVVCGCGHGGCDVVHCMCALSCSIDRAACVVMETTCCCTAAPGKRG